MRHPSRLSPRIVVWSAALTACAAAAGCHAPWIDGGSTRASALPGAARQASTDAPADGEARTVSSEEESTAGQALYHQIQPGETITHLSTRYGIPVSRLLQVNGLDAPDGLKPGQSIYIPPTR